VAAVVLDLDLARLKLPHRSSSRRNTGAHQGVFSTYLLYLPHSLKINFHSYVLPRGADARGAANTGV